MTVSLPIPDTALAALTGAKAPSPSTRLSRRFAETRRANRAALITYAMAGDPDLDASLSLLARLPQAGADIIELGMPFSDPMADGPAIQRAAQRAIADGQTLERLLSMVQVFRQQDDATPIVLMGYLNPIHRFGERRFLAAAAEAGVDGLIVVDLPPEHAHALNAAARAAGIARIPLVAPTTPVTRWPALLAEAGGFVYRIGFNGVTGSQRLDPSAQLATSLAEIRAHTPLPLAVGFGVCDARTAAAVANCADAVVVGSRLVEVFAERGEAAALELVRELRQATERAATRSF